MTTTRSFLPQGVELTDRQRVVLAAMRGTGNVYVYGAPGSGKTTLLDAAHAARPRSVRWHCAEFFRAIHAGLPHHGRSVEATVGSLTGRARWVYFDEFHVHDVADSLYLERALRWWADHRVCVVATSNYPPAGLLPNPLLHHAVEPVIARVEAGFEVIRLDEGVDHRRSSLPAVSGFASGAWLKVVAHGPPTSTVEVGGRRLAVLGPADGPALEVTFADLCQAPLSTNDYLALLVDRESVVVHDLPDPADLGREPAQRLANLVDVAYDRDLPLVVHSNGGPGRLCDAEVPPLDVARTVSRLAALPRRA